MTMARTFAATLLLLLAASFLGAQSSQTTGKELTIEEKFLQKSIELQVLKEQAFAPEYDSKMIALDDLAEKIGKGQQLQVDGSDFPTLAASGLHSPAELERVRSITGKPVLEITRLGRPGASSGIGFLAADEDILSVLHGDNELVRRLGLKHPELARPLFHVWNLLLRQYELAGLKFSLGIPPCHVYGPL